MSFARRPFRTPMKPIKAAVIGLTLGILMAAAPGRVQGQETYRVINDEPTGVRLS